MSVGLIRSWIADGVLPHFRFGANGRRGHIRIAEQDLDGVLAGFKIEATKPKPKPPPKVRMTFKHLKL